ncbi:hypothetical protein RI129_003623 [Pyrocoelia pectoralis]|uniref:Proteasome assembly chaperone 4 n=1 Tax=Pyrocoelia pectoralis TaxID=417401 RepID=A0AAN7VPV4_9COLE
MEKKAIETEKIPLTFKPSQFKLHTFHSEVADRRIVYQVIKMLTSTFICVNYENELTFSDLSLVLTNNSNKPISTQLIGNFSEDSTKNMGMRLCKKLKKNIYLSCNVNNDRFTLPLVEKQLVMEMNKCPDKF